MRLSDLMILKIMAVCLSSVYLSDFLNQLFRHILRIVLGTESKLQWVILLHILLSHLHTVTTLHGDSKYDSY